MTKINIKTVDGGRFEYETSAENANKDMLDYPFISFPIDDCTTKYFNRENIVSITFTEVKND